MTNYEKIKNMSIDEMAKIFYKAGFDVNEKYPDSTVYLAPKNG